MCSLPVDVVERALVHKWEMVLVLAKAIGFQWETAMALLFLGAKDHHMSERDLAEMRRQFALLDPEASGNLLNVYQSRRSAMSAQQEQRHLPQLHAVG
jgi:hypothetical protein